MLPVFTGCAWDFLDYKGLQGVSSLQDARSCTQAEQNVPEYRRLAAILAAQKQKTAVAKTEFKHNSKLKEQNDKLSFLQDY